MNNVTLSTRAEVADDEFQLCCTCRNVGVSVRHFSRRTAFGNHGDPVLSVCPDVSCPLR